MCSDHPARPRELDDRGHDDRHVHDHDFDWEARADTLEVDGMVALPLVDAVIAELVETGLDSAEVAHVVDAGCGPGVITCHLAEQSPAASVTGLDSAGRLLDRLRDRATAGGLAGRVSAVEADIEHDLPPLAPADLVWAQMVVHHVVAPVAVLRRLGDLLRPGGRLVLIEFAGSPSVLPDHDPLVAGGSWRRLEEAATESLRQALGFDMIGHDWPADLACAGFTGIDDRVIAFRHEAPLDGVLRGWLVRHIRRGLGMAGDALAAADVAALEAFAKAVEEERRTDPYVLAERRVLIASHGVE